MFGNLGKVLHGTIHYFNRTFECPFGLYKSIRRFTL